MSDLAEARMLTEADVIERVEEANRKLGSPYIEIVCNIARRVLAEDADGSTEFTAEEAQTMTEMKSASFAEPAPVGTGWDSPATKQPTKEDECPF
tara:strand:+ start:333 stop:617 length:285 start_codon:yes stop_codon:yes gene_type:complete